MAVRVKVTCNYITQPQGNPPSVHLSFSPVYSGSEENKQFFAATPGGSFQFYCTNPEATKQFEMGKEYYFDIFQAEKI